MLGHFVWAYSVPLQRNYKVKVSKNSHHIMQDED